MKKYLITYVTPSGTYNGENIPHPTAEERQAGMQAWMDWARKCGDHLIEMGHPLKAALSINRKGETPTLSPITGYSIMQAESIEQVQALLQDHPHINRMASWSINIHEMLDLPRPLYLSKP